MTSIDEFDDDELDSVFDEEEQYQFEEDEDFRVDTSKYTKKASDVEFVYYSGIDAKACYLHTLEEFIELANNVLFPNVETDWLNLIGMAGASVIWKRNKD